MSDWSIKFQGHIKSVQYSFPESNFIDFKSIHNLPLSTFRYNHSHPRALVFMFHGLHLSSSIFTEMAHHLHLNHFVAVAFDQQGHGLSGGVRGTVYDLEDYSQDCLNFILKVKALYSDDLPVFLAGLSMGGSLCIMTALRRPDLVKGIILFGAALAVDPNFQPIVQKTVSLLNSCCCKNLGLFSIDQKVVCRNQYYESYFRENPEFFNGKLNVRTVAALLGGFRRIQNQAHEVTCSVLLVHGENDKVASCLQAKEFFKNCKSKDKEMLIYPEMFHVVTYEPEFEEIMGKCINWIQARI